MKNTREICKAFFNFNSDLNKGHGIIASIYELMRRERGLASNYFDCLDKRIEREINTCSTTKCFVKLAMDTWTNVEISKSSKWSSVAYIFYVTDKVDVAARKNFDSKQYNDFQEAVEHELVEYLKRTFGDSLSPYAWDVMKITESMIPFKNNSNLTMTNLALGAAGAYILRDLYSNYK